MTIASAINLESNETLLLDIENIAGKGNYQGTWDASTNTPFLVNGVGAEGDYYEVSVGGTIDFGQGEIIFEVGDNVIYNNGVWQRGEENIINDDEISLNTTWSSSKILQVIETSSTADVFTYKGETSALPSGDDPRQAGDVYLLTTDGLPYWYDGDNWRVFGSQQSALPTASADWVGQIFQYIGATGNGLVKGYFYECVSDGEEPATYSWVALSVNFTTEEKIKLAGIESEAQENVIESISVNGTEQTITNKGVDISVPTKTSDITNDSGFIDKTVNDLDNYYTESETDTLLSAKQPKTLDAPITVDGTIETTVEGTLAGLNSAKANSSDLATVATTGDYTDLSNTPTLGTASAKDFTDNVRPNSHDLVESGAVYNAIINSVSSIYTPRGSLSCAELTSALLIEANVGNVYEMSDSGTTSALFLQGAGETINVGDNVGIIKAGESTILFNLMANAFDLTDYQKQDLSSAITIGGVSQTTVEGALGGLNSLIPSNASTSNKLATIGDITGIDYLDELSGAIDLNNYLENKVYIARNGTITSVSNAPDINSSYLNAGFGLQVYSYGATNESNSAFVTQIFTAYPTGDLYYRSRSWGGSEFIWSSWSKVQQENVAYGNSSPFLDNQSIQSYLTGLSSNIKFAVFTVAPTSTSVTDKIVDGNNYYSYFCYSANNTNSSWRVQAVDSATGKKLFITDVSTGSTVTWERVATSSSLTNIPLGDYQLQVGGDNYAWFDLGTSTSTSNSQAFLFYEITYGRVDGGQSKILVSCSGTMADLNYIKIVNLNNTQTSALEGFKLDSNKHLWLGMQSYCYARVKVYGRWTGMGSKTTVEPTGTAIPIYKCVTESDVPHKVFADYTSTTVKTFTMSGEGTHYECKVYYFGGLCGIFDLTMNQFGQHGGYISTIWEHPSFKSYSISVENSTGIVSMAGTTADNILFVICQLP